MLEDGKAQTSQPQAGSPAALWGRSAGGRDRAENSPRQHKSFRAMVRALESKKKQVQGCPHEGSMQGVESCDPSSMQLLSPPNYIFPAASGSPTLSQSSFLAVHPISIPSALPSPHVVAWFSHSPQQWQNALGHLDFGVQPLLDSLCSVLRNFL